MTTFALMSDLHLEFENGFTHSVKIPEVDVLLLAGDICTPWTPDDLQQRVFRSFFNEVSKKAKVTYVICGNHEHYMGYFVDTHTHYYEEYLKPYKNIKLLNNQSEFHDSFAVFGSTFWTDLRNGHPEVKWKSQRGMNDFNHIQYSVDRTSLNGLPKLLPDDIIEENLFSRKKLNDFLLECKEKNVKPIVMTHHALSYELTPHEYQTDLLSFAYANTGLDNLIYDLDREVIFCYGHMHNRRVSKIGMGTFMNNARGYLGHEVQSYNYKAKEFLL